MHLVDILVRESLRIYRTFKIMTLDFPYLKHKLEEFRKQEHFLLKAQTLNRVLNGKVWLSRTHFFNADLSQNKKKLKYQTALFKLFQKPRDTTVSTITIRKVLSRQTSHLKVSFSLLIDSTRCKNSNLCIYQFLHKWKYI